MAIKLIVAGLQMRPRKSPGLVAKAIREGMIRAARRGAACLLTPELILTGYHAHFKQEERDAAIRDILSPACRETGLTLFLGTGNWTSASGLKLKKPFMELLVLGPDGRESGFHHKILPTGGDLKHFSRGKTSDMLVRKIRGIPYGLTICNDFWATPGYTTLPDPNLPVLWAKRGAKVIFHSIASGWGKGYLGFHTRAMEDAAVRNRLWVVSANTAYGRHPVSAPSGILGPDGRWRLKATSQGEKLFVGEVSV